MCQKATKCVATKQALIDHLIGGGKQRLRHTKTERLRGLEVDDKFVLGWCLHRQISRLLAFVDAVCIRRRTPVLIYDIRTVRDEAAPFSEGRRPIDSRGT